MIAGRLIFLSAAERRATEISAEPEEGAQEDHHGVPQRGRPPQESRECLEAKPEEREPRGGSREHQNPGLERGVLRETIRSRPCSWAGASGGIQPVRTGSEETVAKFC